MTQNPYLLTDSSGVIIGGAITGGDIPHGGQAVTMAQYNAAMPGGTFISGTVAAPTQTLAQQAQHLLANGLAITSTGTPALSATYRTQQAAFSRYTAAQFALAGGATSVMLQDLAGSWHSLTPAQFTAIMGAIGAFVLACDLVIDGATGAALPAATATIA